MGLRSPQRCAPVRSQWLVNAILFGNYGRLRDAALDVLGETIEGKTLQVACVYSNLTSRLRERMAPAALLDVVEILPVQLENLRSKLPADRRGQNRSPSNAMRPTRRRPRRRSAPLE